MEVNGGVSAQTPVKLPFSPKELSGSLHTVLPSGIILKVLKESSRMSVLVLEDLEEGRENWDKKD